MKRNSPPPPVTVIDMKKVSVYELLQMIERGEKAAYYMLLSLKSAEARLLGGSKTVHHTRE